MKENVSGCFFSEHSVDTDNHEDLLPANLTTYTILQSYLGSVYR